MLSVRNKLRTVLGLGLPLAFVTVASLMTSDSLSRHAQAQSQGEAIVVDHSSVVSQSPPGYGTNVWWTDQDAALWTERWDELGLTLARVPVPHALMEPVNDNDDLAVINLDGFLPDTPIGLSDVMTCTLTYRIWSRPCGTDLWWRL